MVVVRVKEDMQMSRRKMAHAISFPRSWHDHWLDEEPLHLAYQSLTAEGKVSTFHVVEPRVFQ